MSLILHVLASGSKGNASIVEDSATGRAVLIDCGICKRDFFERCAFVGFDPAKLDAILVTHEHIDHTKGLGVVLRGLAKQDIWPSVYASTSVRRASHEITALVNCFDLQCFKEGEGLSLAGTSAYPFSTSHDAVDSYGFRIEASCGDILGFITDTGVVPDRAYSYLSDCRILALESNHDTKMLQNGSYPYMLKKRIASKWGHLSNTQSAQALESLLSTRLERVVAMHISENNNTYQMPADSFSRIIAQNTHPAQLHTAYQHRAISIR